MPVSFFIFLLSAWSDFLEMFLSDPTIPNGIFIAESWFWRAIFWAFIWFLAVAAAKYISKKMAQQPERQIWSREETLKLIGGGLVLLFFSLMLHLWLVADFWDYVGAKGLAWGMILAGLLYLAGTFIAHLYPGWSRELY